MELFPFLLKSVTSLRDGLVTGSCGASEKTPEAGTDEVNPVIDISFVIKDMVLAAAQWLRIPLLTSLDAIAECS